MRRERDYLAEFDRFLSLRVQRLTVEPHQLFALVHHEGFAEAIVEAERQTSSGRWRRPWLRTTVLSPEIVDSALTSRRASLRVERQIEFDPSHVALARNARVAFVFENLGEVRVVNVDDSSFTSFVLRITTLVPLVMATSATADWLVIGFEDGTAELWHLIQDAKGLPIAQSGPERFSYWVPEYERPQFEWVGARLWYQSDKSELSCLATERDGSDRRRTASWPQDSWGDVRAIAPLPDGCVAAVRVRQPSGRANTMLLHVRDFRVVATARIGGLETTALCADDAGDGIFAAFSDWTVARITLGSALTARDPIAIPELPVALAATTDGILVACERGPLLECHDAQIESLDDGGVMFGPRRALGVRDLFVRDGNVVGVAAEGRVGRLSKGDAARPALLRIEHALLGPKGQLFFGYRRGENELWIRDADTGGEFLVTAESQVSRWEQCAISGTGRFLAVSPNGRGVLIDLLTGSRTAIFVPLGLVSVAGDREAGFWFADRMGAIWFLDREGACRRVANVPLQNPAPAQVMRLEDQLVWWGMVHQQGPHGFDLLSAIVVFEVGVGQSLRLPRQRAFSHPEGAIAGVSPDRRTGELLLVMNGSASARVRVLTATTERLLLGDELQSSLDVAQSVAADVAFGPDGASFYVLFRDGSISRYARKGFEKQATLNPSRPFTRFATAAPGGLRVVAIQAEERAYAID